MLSILLKVFVLVLAILAVTKTYLDFRKKQEVLPMFVFWTVVWVVASAVVLMPQVVDIVAEKAKDQTITIGSVTAAAFIFLLYIVYRVYLKAARIEYRQTQMIQKLGLKQMKGKTTRKT